MPLYVRDLGGKETLIGLVTGIFTLAALIARPLAGIALDRMGRRVIFLVGLAIFILSVLAYRWFPLIGVLLVFRLIHGWGWGFCSTASNTIASDYIPKAHFGEGMGFFSLASSLAMALAPGFGLLWVNRFGFSNLFYLSAGMVTLVFILGFFLHYRPIQLESNPKEKGAIYERTAIPAAVVMFFVCITYGAVTSFLALYAQERGIANIGLFFTVYAVSLLISRPGFGRVYDQWGPRFALIPGLILIFLSMIVLAFAVGLPWFLTAAFIYGIGIGAAQTSLQTMAVAAVLPQRRGSANATFFTGFDSGIGVGAMILGSVAAKVGYSQMYLWSSFAVVVAFVLYIFLAKREASTQN